MNGLAIVLLFSVLLAISFIAQANAYTLEDCFSSHIALLIFNNLFRVEPLDLADVEIRNNLIDLCEFYKSETGDYILANQTNLELINKFEPNKDLVK